MRVFLRVYDILYVTLSEFGFNFKLFFLNRYCKAVYPSKDVRNVVEANDRVLVDNSMVTPYRCLGELFIYCTRARNCNSLVAS